MKKIAFILIFISANVFAKNDLERLEKELITIEALESSAPDCKIIRKNTYNYCVNHGFTKKDAEAIADAALDQCKKVS